MGAPVIIFNYFDIRDFLKDFIESNLHRKGLSYRSFSKQCGFKSPNYFQKLINDGRKLSDKSVDQIVEGLDLDDTSAFYFRLLIKIENEKDLQKRDELIAQAQQFSRFSETEMVVDQTIRCHWLIGVLWELANCDSIEITGEIVKEKLGHIASSGDIQFCLELLEKRGYLKRDANGTFSKDKNINFSAINDKRNLDVRKSHLRFLDLAKLRVHDPLDKREFQGLNIAIPISKFPELKDKIRSTIHEINAQFSEEEGADTVIRVQLAAFQVTK